MFEIRVPKIRGAGTAPHVPSRGAPGDSLMRGAECPSCGFHLTQLLLDKKNLHILCFQYTLIEFKIGTPQIQTRFLYRKLQPENYVNWYILHLLQFFFIPCFFYYQDVYTDIVLAMEYDESPNKTNFMMTMLFVLMPYTLQVIWSIYIHLKQPDVIGMFRRVSKTIRLVIISFIIIF